MMRKKLDETRDHGFPASDQFYLSPTHETLQGTETKAAAATLVHTSIQTFSHLASAMLRGSVGHLSAGRDNNPSLLHGSRRPSQLNGLKCNGAAYLQNSCFAPSIKPQAQHPMNDKNANAMLSCFSASAA